VDVGYKATPPTIAPLPDVSMAAGSVLTVPVNYNDAHTPKDQLVRTLASSDTALLPVSNMKWSGTNLVIAPVGNASGTTTIDVTVRNNDNLSVTESFVLTVNPTPGLFAASGQITIRDANTAQPYPSTIEVSGLSGSILDVNVTLAGLQHSFPQDVSILLVPPPGTVPGVVLMSRAAGSAPISNIRVVFDDEASVVLPPTGTITDGSYRPGDYKASDSYANPAPLGPYNDTLSDLDGINPNGTWSLYVQDEASQDSGLIAQGWTLNISTTGGASAMVVPVDTTLSINQVGDGLRLSINGAPNAQYTIQSTTDLTNWSDAGTVTADESGNADYDIESGSAPAQFFRALPR
jgi:subtilisin-like proprotein convertase family protein